MQKTKMIIGTILFIVLIGGAGIAYRYLSRQYKPETVLPINNENTEVQPKEADKQAPPEKIEAVDFQVYDAEGNAVKLSDFEGKPIVVNFWASWCSPCKSEMPAFEKLYNEMGDEVHFLIVNMTDGERETQDTASSFIAENKYTFPVYYDLDIDAAINYGVTALPTTLFIDAEGYLVTGAMSQLDEETLRLGISFIKP